MVQKLQSSHVVPLLEVIRVVSGLELANRRKPPARSVRLCQVGDAAIHRRACRVLRDFLTFVRGFSVARRCKPRAESMGNERVDTGAKRPNVDPP